MNRGFALAILAATIVAVPGAFAATWYVTPDGLGDAPTIQDAINLAAAGDTVEVAAGTYYESAIDVRDGIHVVSETGTADCATIDAQGIASVFRCVGTDSLASIVGFTITGGRSDFGGGIYCASASFPRIRNCRIVGNTAIEGGGLYLLHAEPVLENCEFEDNVALAFGGGMACASTSFPKLTDCTFVKNSAGDFGGAIASFFYTAPELIRCTLVGNSAGVAGGAIMTLFADIVLQDCIVTGNHAGTNGGAMFLDDTHPTISGCTIAGNRAASGAGGGIFLANDIDLDLTGVILWGNSAPSGAQAYVARPGASLAFTCSGVDTTTGWFGGPGSSTWNGQNITSDPLFCSPEPAANSPTEQGDYGLQSGSPYLALGGACGTVVGGVGPGAACTALASPILNTGLNQVSIRSYPNPFRSSITLEFELATPAPASVRVYDAVGRLVRILDGGRATHNAIAWDGQDDAGRPLAAGVYFSRLAAGAQHGTARLILLR